MPSRTRTAPPRSIALRRELAVEIAARVAALGLTQRAAAAMMGITQPRVSALLAGRIELFSLDALVDLAVRAGLTVRLGVTRPYSRRR